MSAQEVGRLDHLAAQCFRHAGGPGVESRVLLFKSPASDAEMHRCSLTNLVESLGALYLELETQRQPRQPGGRPPAVPV
eukprot:657756-Rhodomonas_salina.2